MRVNSPNNESGPQAAKGSVNILPVSAVVLVAVMFLTSGIAGTERKAPGGMAEGGVEEGGEYGDTFHMFEKRGFVYLHVEGSPREIGYQHGKALSQLVERAMSAYAHLTEERYGFDWGECRAQALNYWIYVPNDQREEIEGIAEGAAEGGAKNPDGATVDRIDVLALNSMWDIWWRSGGVGKRLPSLTGGKDPGGDRTNDTGFPFRNNIHHCSAFVATGSATADGNFVIAQNLWMPFYLSPAHAVFIDIVPDTGNRILMEVTAGMIWSGTEWYLNDAGMVIAETTLGQAPYNWGKVPSFVRLRKAVQYAESIDDFKDIMLENTNGAYCGDYLLADAKTNEVAILELGGNEWELARTKDGFLGSCNYPWDYEVAKEMNAPRGWDHGSYPRYVRLEQLYEKHKGNITVEVGKEIISDHYDTVEEKINPSGHTLCGHVENASGYPWGSLDGKVTNRTLAARFETWARFGHSCGRPFSVSDLEEEHPEYAFDDLVDIIPQPWSTFGPVDPVEVTVEDDEGEKIPNADVELISCEDGWSLNGTTDESGVLTLPYVMHSEYRIAAEAEGLSGEVRGVVDGEASFKVVIGRSEEGGKSFRAGAVSVIGLLVALGAAGAVGAVLQKRKKGR